MDSVKLSYISLLPGITANLFTGNKMRDCDISTGILYMSREGPFQLIGKKSILFPTTKRGYV